MDWGDAAKAVGTAALIGSAFIPVVGEVEGAGLAAATLARGAASAGGRAAIRTAGRAALSTAERVGSKAVGRVAEFAKGAAPAATRVAGTLGKGTVGSVGRGLALHAVLGMVGDKDSDRKSSFTQGINTGGMY